MFLVQAGSNVWLYGFCALMPPATLRHNKTAMVIMLKPLNVLMVETCVSHRFQSSGRPKDNVAKSNVEFYWS